MGVHIVSDEETASLRGIRRLTMRDLDYAALARAFEAFGVDLNDADVLALAAFDHGAAPPGVSDRQFRFEYLAQRIHAGAGLAGFAFARDQIPPSMTRMQAVALSAPKDRLVLAMDTAPAAVLGALEDPRVRQQAHAIVANVGNLHTLAFHLKNGAIAGLFEHHTGLLNQAKLEGLLAQLAAGTLSHKELFADRGHGALIVLGCVVLLFFAVSVSLVVGNASRRVQADKRAIGTGAPGPVTKDIIARFHEYALNTGTAVYGEG